MNTSPFEKGSTVEFLDEIPDGYVEADRDGRVTFANLSFIKALGFSERKEIIGKHLWMFTRKQYLRGMKLTYQTVIESGLPSDYVQIIYDGKNGYYFVGEAAISPLQEHGKVRGTRSMVRDVTHRFETERERAFQKDFLDALLYQAPIAIATIDKTLKISLVNPAFQRLFRCSAEEAEGKPMEHFLSATELKDRLNEYGGQRSPDTAFISGQQRLNNGAMAELEVSVQPFFAGSINYGHLVFCNDITDVRKAEVELVNTTTAYRSVLDTLQDAYFEADARGYITYVNQPLVEATRYDSKEDLIGLHFRHLVDYDSRIFFLNAFKKLFETRQPIRSLQIPYLTKAGTRFSSEVVASPIIDEGIVTGTRGIIRDVSARVQAEELLKAAKEAAESRARELTSLNRLAQQVSRSLNLREILETACREMTRIFPVQSATVALMDHKNHLLKVKASYGKRSPDRFSGDQMIFGEPLDNEVLRDVIEEKQVQIVTGEGGDAAAERWKALFGESGIKALMLVPLITRGETLGCIGMVHRKPGALFHPDQVELAETVTSQIASAMENARLYAQTERALDVAERDLEIGREIQSGFFPRSIPSIQGWEIATFFRAARQVSGDFYDVYPIGKSGYTGWLVADVCDKGVGAALFMVLLRSLIRSSSEQSGDLPPGELLQETISRVNNYVVRLHGRSNMFATLFMGILDPDRGHLHYINAGHEPALVIGPSGMIINELIPTGPAIGFSDEIPFEVGDLPLLPGEIVISYTDGFSEARDMQCLMYSGERFIREATGVWPSAYSVVKHLELDVFSHMGDQVQLDDLTLVGLRRKQDKEVPCHRLTRKAELKNLSHFRNFVAESCRLFQVEEEITESMKMAADEICSNVILHGYQGLPAGDLTVTVEYHESEVRIVTEDAGHPFHPEVTSGPDLGNDINKRKIGGLGIYMVKELMDEIVHERKSGKNHLTFKKYIHHH